MSEIVILPSFKVNGQLVLGKKVFKGFLLLHQRTTRPWYLLNFKHLIQVILNKKIFEYISMHFYGSNLGPPGPGLSWTWGLHTDKLGKGPPDNATYRISST